MNDEEKAVLELAKQHGFQDDEFSAFYEFQEDQLLAFAQAIRDQEAEQAKSEKLSGQVAMLYEFVKLLSDGDYYVAIDEVIESATILRNAAQSDVEAYLAERDAKIESALFFEILGRFMHIADEKDSVKFHNEILCMAAEREGDKKCARCGGTGYASANKDSGTTKAPLMHQQLGVYQCPDCIGTGIDSQARITKTVMEYLAAERKKKGW